MKRRQSIYGFEVSELGDFEGPISKMMSVLKNIKKEFGNDSHIIFDAGYNNVSVYVKPSKKNVHK